jgi:prepilin-type N-terminal cleavage/methylation domain-containing protein
VAGFSIIEVMVVLTIMGILICMAVPSFEQSLEESRADHAAANLRAIWSAERLYWLDNRTYTADLSLLSALGLLDPLIVNSKSPYTYSLAAPDANTFEAAAARNGSTRWTGQFTIDQTGTVSGSVQNSGETVISSPNG